MAFRLTEPCNYLHQWWLLLGEFCGIHLGIISQLYPKMLFSAISSKSKFESIATSHREKKYVYCDHLGRHYPNGLYKIKSMRPPFISRNLIRASNVIGPYSLRWRHNGHDGVSDHQPRDCYPHIRVKIKAPRQWPLCWEFTGAGEFPAQMPVTRKMFPFDDAIMW